MTTSPKPRNEDTEDFIEDILGFNFRSFRTIYALFVKPRAVFQAYAERDRETYTPSLRIWLGIIGLQVLFSVVWGGYGGLILSQWQAGDSQESKEDYSCVNLPVYVARLSGGGAVSDWVAMCRSSCRNRQAG